MSSNETDYCGHVTSQYEIRAVGTVHSSCSAPEDDSWDESRIARHPRSNKDWPVVDIKPWMLEFGPRGEVLQPLWSTELMKGYW
jgi:hypothetical protein